MSEKKDKLKVKVPLPDNADPKVLDEAHKSLMCMQVGPAQPPSKEQLNTINHSDYLLIKDVAGEWKKYWAVLKGDKLLYYKEKSEASPKGSLEVNFATANVITSEDGLARKQAQKDLQSICKYRVSIFSPTAYHTTSGESDSQMEAWLKVIQTLLGLKFSPEELETKTKASQHLEPLMEQQRARQREQYQSLLKTLQSVGLFWKGKGERPVKEGYMKLKEEGIGGGWKKYYVRLFKDNCSYYRLDNKSTPYGILALHFVIQIAPVKNDTTCRTFKVITPLRSYSFKAKHHIAMKTWINALNAVKSGKPLEDGPDGENEIALLSADLNDLDLPSEDIYNGTLRLRWSDEEGDHKYKIKPGKKKLTVGRASNSDIKIADSRSSRNHAAIEFKGKVPVYLDFGSSHGSKVNGVKVSKLPLKPGDVIKIGDTSMRFEVLTDK
eukprot:TRINITY_DN1443_c0_g1_i2.p1 TRINITY_DN1443_c0_g1~~TRINITY_DN1443_c0_g1_i2.p1  ORF type:complete len:438 (+),score=109.82 TRINITY_DN1443_c0_g1_i2:212-1525(+)